MYDRQMLEKLSRQSSWENALKDVVANWGKPPLGWPDCLPTSLHFYSILSDVDEYETWAELSAFEESEPYGDFGDVDEYEDTDWNGELSDGWPRYDDYLIRKGAAVAIVRFSFSDKGRLIWWREFPTQAEAVADFQHRNRENAGLR